MKVFTHKTASRVKAQTRKPRKTCIIDTTHVFLLATKYIGEGVKMKEIRIEET